MAKADIKVSRRKSEDAWSRKMKWDQLLRECYAYAAPERSLYDTSANGDGTDTSVNAGKRKSAHLTDSTLTFDATVPADCIILLFRASDNNDATSHPTGTWNDGYSALSSANGGFIWRMKSTITIGLGHDIRKGLQDRGFRRNSCAGQTGERLVLAP